MGDNTMKIKALIRFLVVSVILVRKISTASSSPGSYEVEVEVEIFDGLPSGSPPLTFRCASEAAGGGKSAVGAYAFGWHRAMGSTLGITKGNSIRNLIGSEVVLLVITLCFDDVINKFFF
ncbi:UNVERIFIED_CONTAM: hypothetical protein Slati_2581400 [Sesamum latifolium]|uniref:Uncharacterized protein n=1 Tax=Sesamum latifolium TaxID=2727402 RepID=A0AAW2VTP5_9LAMI